jgi:hypothetical protein
MERYRKAPGQALVETALLLPLLFVTCAGLLQLVFLIYTQMHLQHTASRLAALRSTGASRTALLTELYRRRSKGPGWGFLDVSSLSIRENPIQSWRHYPGIATLRTPGNLVTVSLTYRFFPRLIFRWVRKTGAFAERPQAIRLAGES